MPELQWLSAFDAMRASIDDVTRTVYSRGRNSITLTAVDLRWGVWC